MLLTNAFVLHSCHLGRPNASGFRPLTDFIEIRFALVQSRGGDRRDQKSMKNLNIPAAHCGLLFSGLYRVQSSSEARWRTVLTTQMYAMAPLGGRGADKSERSRIRGKVDRMDLS